MAVTAIEYRADNEGTLQEARRATKRSSRDAEAQIRKWAKEAGHTADELSDAETEYGSQWDAGNPDEVVWEVVLDSRV